jgi:hypothetical protein
MTISIRDLVKQLNCVHCNSGVPLDDDRHVWENGSHAFCPRKIKLTKVEGIVIGLNQQVYSTQWHGLDYVVCHKCGKLVNLHGCWLDMDGSQRHHSCLSKERMQQLQKA